MLYNKQIFKRCFCYSGRYWYCNIKHIPLYFKQIFHLMKYGYDDFAVWETFSWFTTTMRSVLKRYKRDRHGTPILIDNYPTDSSANDEESQRLIKENDKMWEDIINRMIELLDLMDEQNPKYETDEYEDAEGMEKQRIEMDAAKDEFFGLFSKYFYHLWD